MTSTTLDLRVPSPREVIGKAREVTKYDGTQASFHRVIGGLGVPKHRGLKTKGILVLTLIGLGGAMLVHLTMGALVVALTTTAMLILMLV